MTLASTQLVWVCFKYSQIHEVIIRTESTLARVLTNDNLNLEFEQWEMNDDLVLRWIKAIS